MPYIPSQDTPLQTLVATPTFEAQAKRAGVSEAELKDICDHIAADPMAGDIMPGTGGARKLRHRSQAGGKSGGWRTIHYFAGRDIPVFLLAIYGKSQRDNLTKAERNDLACVLPLLADAYKMNTARKRNG
jgi:hypothetical protein